MAKRQEDFEYKKSTDKNSAILGTLEGPCADIVNGTRNGRKYSDELWQKAFNDPIVKEQLANGGIFGEAGHPADREEIDIEKIAIAMPEAPVKKDGKLWAKFHILDTPCGRVLKTLCDYGYNIGISSRGTGDVIEGYDGEQEVDPDTYNFTCFDAVIVPAVKEARMKYVAEGLERKKYNKTLKERLVESIDKASDKDKKLMKETLDNLGININEDNTVATEANESVEKVEESIEAPKYTAVLKAITDALENADEDEDKADIEDLLKRVKHFCDEVANDYDINLNKEELEEAKKVDLVSHPTEDITLIYQDKEVKDMIEGDDETLSMLIDSCEDALHDHKVEAFHIKYDDDMAEWYVEEELEEKCQKEECNTEECADKSNEAVEESAETEDNGTDEIVEQLQDALKENATLKERIQELQNKLAVSDTEVNKVNEDLAHYKAATVTLSGKAKEAKTLEKKVSTLTEKLETAEKDLKAKTSQKLNEDTKTSRRLAVLAESVKKKESEVKELTEQLEDVKANAELKRSEYNKTITKAKTLIKEYKQLAKGTVDRYIESKAVMLGVTANEIKNRLNENYSLDEIDKVCESLQSYQVNISKLPFNINRNVRVTESKKEALQVQSPFDDEIDEDLLALAKMHF